MITVYNFLPLHNDRHIHHSAKKAGQGLQNIAAFSECNTRINTISETLHFIEPRRLQPRAARPSSFLPVIFQAQRKNTDSTGLNPTQGVENSKAARWQVLLCFGLNFASGS